MALYPHHQRTVDRLSEVILNFTAWDTPPGGWPARFMEDTEWAWRRGSAAVGDW